MGWIRTDDGWRRPPAGPVRLAAVLLHGVGLGGADMHALGDDWAAAIPGLALSAPDGIRPFDRGSRGRQWFSITDLTEENRPGRMAAAAGPLAALIEAERAHWQVPADRLVLAGFSQGTIMALHLAVGGQTACGLLLGYSGLLATPVTAARRCPVLLVHGTDDAVLPAARLGHAVGALAAAGWAVEAHALAGVGHRVTPEGIAIGRRHLAAFAMA